MHQCEMRDQQRGRSQSGEQACYLLRERPQVQTIPPEGHGSVLLYPNVGMMSFEPGDQTIDEADHRVGDQECPKPGKGMLHFIPRSYCWQHSAVY